MSKKPSASIYIITRLKRNCVNANECTGVCQAEIIQIIISLSRKMAHLVSSPRQKAWSFENPAFQIIPIVSAKASSHCARGAFWGASHTPPLQTLSSLNTPRSLLPGRCFFPVVEWSHARQYLLLPITSWFMVCVCVCTRTHAPMDVGTHAPWWV